MKTTKAKGRHPNVAERIEYNLLLALSFVICLFGIVLSRIFTGAPDRKVGVFAEAKSSASAAVGYAFKA